MERIIRLLDVLDHDVVTAGLIGGALRAEAGRRIDPPTRQHDAAGALRVGGIEVPTNREVATLHRLEHGARILERCEVAAGPAVIVIEVGVGTPNLDAVRLDAVGHNFLSIRGLDAGPDASDPGSNTRMC